MAPVIWGLDLKEMQWAKFKSSYMWNNVYHLRRTKFIVYQIAMICCVVSESLGTDVLSDYITKQDYIEYNSNRRASFANDNYVGMASFNIFNGIYVATIFGGGFFFDLFWPERKESQSVRLAWRICAIIACMFCFAAAVGMTVITARQSARIGGVSATYAQQLNEAAGDPPLEYRQSGRAIAAVVFIWPGFLATVASTVLLFVSLTYVGANGPFSAHVRAASGADQEKNAMNAPEDTQMGETHYSTDKGYGTEPEASMRPSDAERVSAGQTLPAPHAGSSWT